jgi:surfeit locus 1 family protein
MSAMLQRLREARLLWPAVTAAAALPILIGLGTWQLQRKAWKDGLIQAIAVRAKAPPVPLDAVLKGEQSRDLAIEYARVVLRGRYLNAQERYLYGLDEALGPGEHVYTPFQTSDGHWLVMVNRGFVTAERKSPGARAAGQIEGETEVVGLVRGGEEKGLFEPANDPAHNQWFFRDIPAMAAGIALSQGRKLAPVVVEAEAKPEPPGGWPKGGVTRLVLPNRHLEYAFTWYGLAAALVAVFAMFAHERLSPPGGRHDDPDPVT